MSNVHTIVSCRIAFIKKKLFCFVLQAPTRRQSFKEKNPNIPLPPNPIITRWGTWLEACEYYADNFDGVKAVVDEFDDNDAQSIRTAKDIFALPNIKQQLAFIKAHFMNITKSIKTMESKGLELKVYIDIIENIRTELGTVNDRYAQRFEQILARNPGYTSLHQIKNILYENAVVQNT